MTDQYQDDSDIEWVRRTYAGTPTPAPRAIDTTVAAVMAAVRDTTAGKTGRQLPLRRWWRWTPVAAAIAAMCIVIVVWRDRDKTNPLGSHVRAITLAPAVPHGGAPVAPSPLSKGPARTIATPDLEHVAEPPTAPSLQVPMATVAPTNGADSLQSRAAVPPHTVATTAPEPTLRQRAVAGLDSESATLVLRILDGALARGLPLEALAARVHEGVRRKVPGPRIVVVTRNFAAALADARAALGASAMVAEVQSGAEALLAGAPAAALRQLRAARPSGSIAEPLAALADLSTYGVAPLRASAALAALLAKSGSDAGVRTLRAGVISDIIRGVSPDAALAGRIRKGDGQDLQQPPTPLDGREDSMPMHRGKP